MALSAVIPLAGLFKAIVIGAVVGAVVGGLTAAIKGGDILKGVLFGAIGGAVTGGLLYGADKVITGMMSTATTSSATNTAAGATFGAETARGVASGAIKSTVVEAAAPSFFGGIMDDIGSGFKDIFGDAAKDTFAAGAVSAGIKGGADIYMQKEAAKAADIAADKKHKQEMEALDKTIASNEKIAGMRGGGSGGGGRRGTEDELALIREQNAGALARVNAEVAGQSALRSQEFANADRIRQLAADAGAGLSTEGREVASTSTESLVDVQDRIRAGEDTEGNPNAGYKVPVDYVPPDPQYVV